MASSGVAVAQRFLQIRSAPGQFAFWWLGQSGFAVRAGDSTLLLDPFLSPNPDRVVEAPIRAEDCTFVDVVACTHEHIDHFDAPTVKTIARVAPQARFVLPEPIAGMALDLGIPRERVIGVQPGETHPFGDLTIRPVPACHGRHMIDAYTEGREESGGLVRFLGYVVEAAGVRLYHAGDTLVYDQLVDLLRPMRVDVALLPINGRSYFREAADLVGNMGPRDAVALAQAIGCSLLVPMHWDAFAKNLGYPDHLVEVAGQNHPSLSILVPGRNRPFVYAHIP